MSGYRSARVRVHYPTAETRRRQRIHASSTGLGWSYSQPAVCGVYVTADSSDFDPTAESVCAKCRRYVAANPSAPWIPNAERLRRNAEYHWAVTWIGQWLVAMLQPSRWRRP